LKSVLVFIFSDERVEGREPKAANFGSNFDKIDFIKFKNQDLKMKSHLKVLEPDEITAGFHLCRKRGNRMLD
jgi:hypothetical protein